MQLWEPMDAPIIGYLRVSTHDQSENGHGLEAQEAAVRAWAEARGVDLELVRDTASGADRDRDGLTEALERVSSGQASGLVVAKLDRLSRSLIHTAELLDFFTEAGATFVALDLGVDTSTANGRLVASVLASVAEWERHTISDRTKAGLAAIRAEGKPISRPTVDAKVSRRIRRLRDRGYTLQAISDRLNRDGVPTARGGTTWRPSTVANHVERVRPRKAKVPA